MNDDDDNVPLRALSLLNISPNHHTYTQTKTTVNDQWL